jgi:hypothetical protein
MQAVAELLQVAMQSLAAQAGTDTLLAVAVAVAVVRWALLVLQAEQAAQDSTQAEAAAVAVMETTLFLAAQAAEAAA